MNGYTSPEFEDNEGLDSDIGPGPAPVPVFRKSGLSGRPMPTRPDPSTLVPATTTETPGLVPSVESTPILATPPTGVTRTSLMSFGPVAGGALVGFEPLLELKFSKEEREVAFFTLDGETVCLHYETGLGFIRCYGRDCPLCRFGKPAVETMLVPVIAVDDGDVKTLRLPKGAGRQEAHSMLPQVLKLAQAGALAKNTLLVTSPEKGRYVIEVVPGDPVALAGLEAVVEFRRRYDAGEVFLADTFKSMSLDEMNAIPWIKRKLDVARLRRGA
jgi:hypothetical protein